MDMKKIKDSLEKIKHEVVVCAKCRLALKRIKPVPGEGPAEPRFMLIGEAPGNHENELGRPFVGTGGRFLNEILTKFGVDRRKIFITSVIKCHPPGNRRPKEDEIESCLPYLWRQLNLLNPALIVLLGDVALKSVLHVQDNLADMHGSIVFWEGREIIPTYHPNAALRFPKARMRMQNDISLVIEELKRMQLWEKVKART